MTLEIFIYGFLAISFAIFCHKRLLLLLQLFQQEEYDGPRFLSYILKDFRLVDKKLSAALLIMITASYVFAIPQLIVMIVCAVDLLFFAYISQQLIIQNSKKSLVITSRVKRLLWIFYVMMAGLFYLFACWHLQDGFFGLIYLVLLIQLIPLLIVFSNIMLQPYEKIIQKSFLRQAEDKISSFSPQIIAITGSYGKTSTKHILYHILSSVAPTLTTPGSVNTQMGITRIIREKLQKEHKYFIVEMGAYGIGSIKKLCDLTPPDSGIITAVGNAHYERFKTIDNVAQAKFELNQAVAKKQGKTFVNADMVADDYIKKYGSDLILVGQQKLADGYEIKECKQVIDGLELKIKYGRKTYKIAAPLYGSHHGGNIALAFALAHDLGIDADTIIAALKTVPQIKHRLELLKPKNAAVIIDDAYNSNPTGFNAALGILELFKKERKSRTILVTPGMVELGDLHDEKHQEIALKAAKIVDIAIVIMPHRIPSFIKTFNENKKPQQQLFEFESFVKAKEWIDNNARSGDVILYENDLPDLYENKIKL